MAWPTLDRGAPRLAVDLFKLEEARFVPRVCYDREWRGLVCGITSEFDTMSVHDDRRYGIGEVSKLTGVSIHLLRQWEERVPQLKPNRDSADRRYYMSKDIEIVRRIKQLRLHEKLTFQGVSLRISQELHGEGRPKTNREVIDLIDKIEAEARAMLNILDGPARIRREDAAE